MYIYSLHVYDFKPQDCAWAARATGEAGAARAASSPAPTPSTAAHRAPRAPCTPRTSCSHRGSTQGAAALMLLHSGQAENVNKRS